MKHTILSQKDSELIEQAIIRYGRIVSIDSLMRVFTKEYTNSSAHNRINKLSRLGWFRRIKQGLYLIIDTISARSQIDISLLSIANALVSESYVSLSHALNYYQLFDQYTNTVVSITAKENKKYKFDDNIFKFSKVKNNMYFGFVEKMDHGNIIKIAEIEKALIDYLYLDKSFGSASLVFEKIKNYHNEIDLKKLQDYALKSGLTVRRKIGFFLDCLNLNSDRLYQSISDNRGFSRFTRNSKKFNAKWRIYYDDKIIG